MKVALLPKKTRGEAVRFSLRCASATRSRCKGTAPAGSLAGVDAVARHARARRARRSTTRSTRCARRSASAGIDAASARRARRSRANIAPTAEARRRGDDATPSFAAARVRQARARAARVARERRAPIRRRSRGRAFSRHAQSVPGGRRALRAHVRGADRATARGEARRREGIPREVLRRERRRARDRRRFRSRRGRARWSTQLFGSWKSPSPYARVPDPYHRDQAGRATIETPDKANAVLVGGMAIPMTDPRARLRGDARRRAHPRRRHRRRACSRSPAPEDRAVVRRRHASSRPAAIDDNSDARALRDLRAAERREGARGASPRR